jgi:hypothetical protein
MQPHEHVVLPFTVIADILPVGRDNNIDVTYVTYYER